MNVLLLVWCASAALAAPAAQSSEPAVAERASVEGDGSRVFMPAGELGSVWFADPNLGTGLMMRTSIEARYRRVRAPFLRVSYDATWVPYTTTRSSDQASLKASATVHEMVMGGGMRFGHDRLQVAPSIVGGLRVSQLPSLHGGLTDLEVGTRSVVSAVVAPSVGVELYLEPDTAVTVDVSADCRLLGRRNVVPAQQSRPPLGSRWVVGSSGGETSWSSNLAVSVRVGNGDRLHVLASPRGR